MDNLNELIKILDELISAYEVMAKLYEEKKASLIKNHYDELGVLDNRIIENYEHLKFLNNKRKILSNELGDENMNLSTLIELASQKDEHLAEEFSLRKVKINELSSQLLLLEKTNVELINHGLILSEKSLSMYIDAVEPQANLYDKSGKNVDTTGITMSSVVEEA